MKQIRVKSLLWEGLEGAVMTPAWGSGGGRRRGGSSLLVRELYYCGSDGALAQLAGVNGHGRRDPSW